MIKLKHLLTEQGHTGYLVPTSKAKIGGYNAMRIGNKPLGQRLIDLYKEDPQRAMKWTKTSVGELTDLVDNIKSVINMDRPASDLEELYSSKMYVVKDFIEFMLDNDKPHI